MKVEIGRSWSSIQEAQDYKILNGLVALIAIHSRREKLNDDGWPMIFSDLCLVLFGISSASSGIQIACDIHLKTCMISIPKCPLFPNAAFHGSNTI
jgi:hypothetical protein